MGSETRQKTAQIKVRISPEDKDLISMQAENSGLTTSGFLRELGLSYEPRSKIDPEVVERLSRLYARLNYIGDQLKEWLSQDNEHSRSNAKKSLYWLKNWKAFCNQYGFRWLVSS